MSRNWGIAYFAGCLGLGLGVAGCTGILGEYRVVHDSEESPDGASGPGDAAVKSGGDGSKEVPDTSTDSGVTAPFDGGGGKDTGVPNPPVDSGVPPQDSSIPGDSGAGMDAKVPDAANDASEPPPDAQDLPPKAQVDALAIDFGPSNCGGQAASPESLKIQNIGGGRLAWSASLEASTQFHLTGSSSGTLGPNEFATMTLTAERVDTNALAGTVLSTNLILNTNDAEFLQVKIPVSVTAYGGTLEIAPLSPSFGEVPLRMQSDIPIQIKNVGNGSIGFAFANVNDGDFSIITSPSGMVTLAAKESVPSVVGRFLPSQSGSQTGNFALSITGALCGDNPNNIQMDGSAASGAISVSPSELDFGLVNCGTTPLVKTIQISNTGAASFNWTARNLSSGFRIQPSSGTVSAGMQTTLLVTPDPIPSQGETADNHYGGSVDIESDVVGDSPHKVEFKLTARGAKVNLNPTEFGFEEVILGDRAASQLLALENAGNVVANVTTTFPSDFFGSMSSVSLNPNGFANISIGFVPTRSGARNGEAVVNIEADAYCGPSTARLKMAGTGVCPAATPVVKFSEFAIEMYEVTRAQYTCFLEAKGNDTSGQVAECSTNTSYFPTSWTTTSKASLKLPVNNVDWCDAAAYCAWAGRRLCGKIGGGATPSESRTDPLVSEWSNACSSAGKNTYAYGSSLDTARCNVSESNNGAGVVVGKTFAQCHAPEAPYASLFDMSGNLSEWENSCTPRLLPLGTDSCVARGGSYSTSGADSKCTLAPAFGRDKKFATVGIRCCE